MTNGICNESKPQLDVTDWYLRIDADKVNIPSDNFGIWFIERKFVGLRVTNGLLGRMRWLRVSIPAVAWF